MPGLSNEIDYHIPQIEGNNMKWIYNHFLKKLAENSGLMSNFTKYTYDYKMNKFCNHISVKLLKVIVIWNE